MQEKNKEVVNAGIFPALKSTRAFSSFFEVSSGILKFSFKIKPLILV